MAVRFQKAKHGYQFVLTEFGMEVSNIRAKFSDTNKKNQYLHSVPVSWITKGYVVEVKEGE